jgi:hypothetical protein
LRALTVESKSDEPWTVPEQRRCFLECRRLGELGDVAAPIVQASAQDGRNGCRDDRFAPSYRACGNCGGALAPFAPPGEATDIRRPIKTATRIVRIGPHPDLAAAYIGIERLRAHFQQFERLIASQPGLHIDYLDQD